MITPRPTQPKDWWREPIAVLKPYDVTWVWDVIETYNVSWWVSSAINWHVVRIVALTDTYVAIWTAPVATATNWEFRPEWLVEYKKINSWDKIYSTWDINIVVQV